jgi:hypothetical protein
MPNDLTSISSIKYAGSVGWWDDPSDVTSIIFFLDYQMLGWWEKQPSVPAYHIEDSRILKPDPWIQKFNAGNRDT